MKAGWAAALAAAARLGIAPAAFWRLSVAEWRALAGGSAGAPTRAAFEALMCAHPDRKDHDG